MKTKRFKKRLKRASTGRVGSRDARSLYLSKSKTLGKKQSMEDDHLLGDKKLDRKNIELARKRKKRFKARLIDPRKRKTIGDKLRATRVKNQQRRVDERRAEVLAGEGGTAEGREAYAKLMDQRQAMRDARKKNRA